jgi:RNA polymerase sigma-70 factor (ECF subfamily)
MDLEAAIARLPEGARTAFVLHELQGYSHGEIAALTGVAAATIRAQLFRARRRLMEVLER